MSGLLHIGVVDGQHVVIYAANGFGMAEMMGPRMEKKKKDANTLVEAVNNIARVTAERDKLRAAVERIRTEIAWLDKIDPHAIAIADYDGSASIIKACCDAVLAETHKPQPQPGEAK